MLRAEDVMETSVELTNLQLEVLISASVADSRSSFRNPAKLLRVGWCRWGNEPLKYSVDGAVKASGGILYAFDARESKAVSNSNGRNARARIPAQGKKLHATFCSRVHDTKEVDLGVS